MPADRATLEPLPRVSALVPRCALCDRLSSAHPGEVILVCGPPGSGKTNLLREWAESERLTDRLGWVALERDEQDAQHFWLSVVDELAGATGEGAFSPKVGATPAFAGQAVVDRLLSHLASLREPVVLVIDDLHELRSADALEWLERFLASLPRTLRVVLATREDPRLGLHRLRLAGALTEIRGADLRFSLEEARDLVEASGVALTDRGVAELHERTEGWAAGLRLAVISLAGHPDPDRFVTEFSGSERTVAGYLLAEVLERQPAEVRDLLLRTSMLDRVNGPLADALTGGSGAEAILQRLEDAGAFVSSIDARRSWFRYHHLLADLLRLELRRTAPATVGSLHRAAARWYEENGYMVDAIRHARAARDWPRAARLLADIHVGLVFDGRTATVRALLATFPADVVDADAELALAFATGLFHDGRIDESEKYVALAERSAPTVRNERRQLFDLRLSSARLSLACRRGDLDTALEAMCSLEAALEASTVTDFDRSNDHRASALMNLGIAELWSLRFDDARRDLEDGLALVRRIGRPYLEVGCLGHMALAAGFSGSPVSVALRLSEDALALAEAHGWGADPVAAPAVAARAEALVWLGRFDEAEQWLQRAASAEPGAAQAQTDPVLHHARGLLRLAQRRFADALAEFRAAEKIQRRVAPEHALTACVRGAIAGAQLLMGDGAAARNTLAGLVAEERDRSEVRLPAAAIELAEGRPQAAVELLAPLIDGSGRALHQPLATINALLLDAVARDDLGDRRAAAASIERALELAEPDGLVLPFVLAPVRELLERLPSHHTAHVTMRSTILSALDGFAPRSDSETTRLRVELSQAELRVVRYLPSNLKAPEIASELFVSANTVRTHLRHIYTKLGAHSRSEAVACARDLGVLAPRATSR